MRRTISLLLAFALTAALCPLAGAAEFKDLEGNWAKTEILRLAELGYLNGYSDGTIRPDNSVTSCEALAMLARFYPLDDATVKLVHEDYGTFVSSNIDPTLSWAYDEIEVCLAAGILSENELKSIRLTAPIGKETLAVLLVRAMQLVKEAAQADSGSLTFTDREEITKAFRGHIVVLVDAGIITGDNNNRFNSHSSVSRAVAAAMLVRSLDYNAAKGRTLELKGYNDVQQYTGLVSDLKGNKLTLRDTSGLCRVYEVPTEAEITLNGTAVRLSDALRGDHAVVRIKDKALLSIAADDQDYWIQGRLTGVTKEDSGYALHVREPESDEVERYVAPTSADVTVDGEKRDAAALRENMFVTLTTAGRTVKRATAASGSFTLSGTITTLVYGTPVNLEISDSEGARLHFSLDLSDLPTITRGGNEVGVDRLAVGDSVTLTIRNCELDRIDATSTETSLDGVVKSIVSDEEKGLTWIIQDDLEERHSLTVDPAASAYQGPRSILVNEIQVGDTVTVSTNGHSITEIHLRSTSANNAGKLTGTILTKDPDARQITVSSTAGRLVYITVQKEAALLNAVTGKTVNLSLISIDAPVVVYGAYTDANKFEAISVVIEG